VRAAARRHGVLPLAQRAAPRAPRAAQPQRGRAARQLRGRALRARGAAGRSAAPRCLTESPCVVAPWPAARGCARRLQRDTTPHFDSRAARRLHARMHAPPVRPQAPLSRARARPHPDVNGCEARRLQRRACQRDGCVGPSAALARRRRRAAPRCARAAGGARRRARRHPPRPPPAPATHARPRRAARPSPAPARASARRRRLRRPAQPRSALLPRRRDARRAHPGSCLELVCRQGADRSGAGGWRAGRRAGSGFGSSSTYGMPGCRVLLAHTARPGRAPALRPSCRTPRRGCRHQPSRAAALQRRPPRSRTSGRQPSRWALCFSPRRARHSPNALLMHAPPARPALQTRPGI